MDENIVIIEPNPNSRTAMRAALATAARSFEPLARRTLAHWKSTDEVPVCKRGYNAYPLAERRTHIQQQRCCT